MTASATNISAQKIWLSVSSIQSIPAHPAAVIDCANCILGHNSNRQLAVYVESNPAIGLAVIEACRKKNITVDFNNIDFTTLLGKLGKKEFLKTIFTLPIYNTENPEVLSLASEITVRSGKRALAARGICQKAGLQKTSGVYMAALLAEVGLLALLKLYTKSTLLLTAESDSDRRKLLNLEKENLGITDNILSSRLIEKWKLPQSISDTVWLYPEASGQMAEKLPNSSMISVLKLAETLTDSNNSPEESTLCAKLNLTETDTEQIKQNLQNYNLQTTNLNDSDSDDLQKQYLEVIKNTYISQLTSREEETSETLLLQKFTDSVTPQSSSIEVAAALAKAISDSFATQSVCVFTKDVTDDNIFGTILIEGCSEKSLVIEGPKDFSITQAKKENLEPWLFEQIQTDSQKARFVPITDSEQIIGGIIITGSAPDESILQQPAIGRIFANCYKSQQQKAIAQIALDCAANTADVKTETKSVETAPLALSATDGQSITEIAGELAAGAAHEINNPLLLISGRAQLLLQEESDDTKKLILNQIIDNTKNIEQIIGQLMNYAKPAEAKIRAVSPFIVLNNCLEKVNAKYVSEPLDINLENIEDLCEIAVDAEQICEAIAQIIYNALESYESGNGPIQISGIEDVQNSLVKLTIKDYGSGMNAETLNKACEPFFSDKPAGRQRGMGLATASGLLKNNNCTITIESQPDSGTVVTINLPAATKNI